MLLGWMSIVGSHYISLVYDLMDTCNLYIRLFGPQLYTSYILGRLFYTSPVSIIYIGFQVSKTHFTSHNQPTRKNSSIKNWDFQYKLFNDPLFSSFLFIFCFLFYYPISQSICFKHQTINDTWHQTLNLAMRASL